MTDGRSAAARTPPGPSGPGRAPARRATCPRPSDPSRDDRYGVGPGQDGRGGPRIGRTTAGRDAIRRTPARPAGRSGSDGHRWDGPVGSRHRTGGRGKAGRRPIGLLRDGRRQGGRSEAGRRRVGRRTGGPLGCRREGCRPGPPGRDHRRASVDRSEPSSLHDHVCLQRSEGGRPPGARTTNGRGRAGPGLTFPAARVASTSGPSTAGPGRDGPIRIGPGVVRRPTGDRNGDDHPAVGPAWRRCGDGRYWDGRRTNPMSWIGSGTVCPRRSGSRADHRTASPSRPAGRLPHPGGDRRLQRVSRSTGDRHEVARPGFDRRRRRCETGRTADVRRGRRHEVAGTRSTGRRLRHRHSGTWIGTQKSPRTVDHRRGSCWMRCCRPVSKRSGPVPCRLSPRVNPPVRDQVGREFYGFWAPTH